MARKQRHQITEKEITGLKFFDKLVPLLDPLHHAACTRDKAGNRQLHFDQLCLLELLCIFNPMIDSLRAIQQASTIAKVQKRLGCARAALGSLSEAQRLFDPSLLEPIIAELGRRLEPIGRDTRLGDVPHLVTLVDGTLLKALPAMAAASLLKAQTGSALVKWRLHTHFEVARGVPVRIEPRRDGGGEDDERAVLEQSIESDHCYVIDRGYAKFTLFNAIHGKQSSYVCRLRDNSRPQVIEDRPLSEAARLARVLSDQIVSLGATSASDARPDHAIRLVIVKIKPHVPGGKTGGGKTGPGSDGYLRIATNLLDVPAEIIALLYERRWSIEIFFRFFKQILGCRHLLSHSENGIRIQVYCAIIACMLISLWTGRKPTKRTCEMICYYMIGLASEEELLAHLEQLKKLDEIKNHQV